MDDDDMTSSSTRMDDVAAALWGWENRQQHAQQDAQQDIQHHTQQHAPNSTTTTAAATATTATAAEEWQAMLWDAIAEGLLARILVFNLVRFFSLCTAGGLVYGAAYILLLALTTPVGWLVVAASATLHATRSSVRIGDMLMATASQCVHRLPWAIVVALLAFEAGLLQCQRFIVTRIPEHVRARLSIAAKRHAIKPLVSALRRVAASLSLAAATLARPHHEHACKGHQHKQQAEEKQDANKEHAAQAAHEAQSNEGEEGMRNQAHPRNHDHNQNDQQDHRQQQQQQQQQQQRQDSHVTLETLPYDVWNSHLRHQLDALSLVRLSSTSRSLYHSVHALPLTWDGRVASLVLLDTSTPHWEAALNSWYNTLPITLPLTVDIDIHPPLDVCRRAFAVRTLGDPAHTTRVLNALRSIQPRMAVFTDWLITDTTLQGIGCQHLALMACRTPAGFTLDATSMPQHLQSLTVFDLGEPPHLSINTRGLDRIRTLELRGAFTLWPSSFGCSNRRVRLFSTANTDVRHLARAEHVTLVHTRGLTHLDGLHSVRHLTLAHPHWASGHEPFPLLPHLNTVFIKAVSTRVLPSFAPLAHVTTVSIHESSVRDVSPLASASNVTLVQCHAVDDLSPLKRVHTLVVNQCNCARGVAALTHVTSLSLCRVPVGAEVSRLRSTHLRSLSLEELDGVRHIGPFPNLHYLHVRACHTLSRLSINTSLRTLRVEDCNALWNLLAAACVPSVTVADVDALVPGPFGRRLLHTWRGQ
ncbi:hypothetical protein PTSG_05710 [Salpingoeca rosetta]|uniref:Uncharacterized protein n=1 Tax=Salpingoeca rosetta (strain ATCC 50818 / BSB-021) TaxID=946362 RepID=F2UB00_SALR5|nr:uncharacterized protein PTSG_05710 [Salpingoeca rosetta]EGD74013.1 hypothetical protein PTSG_05710 [Salpingoeca rosetta]|eukprot:XP_004993575.1 hypothetical protein PTSG_05710 [Salpingoeca rosetta]